MTKLLDIKTTPDKTSTVWVAVLAFVCSLAMVPQTQAEGIFNNAKGLFNKALFIHNDADDGLFIPDNLKFYNPLEEGDGHRAFNPRINGLDSVALYQAAENYRSNEINSSQRALNHQWLSQYHNDEGVRQGGKVLSKLFKMGFKTYWSSVKNGKYHTNNYVPNVNGIGKFTEDIDYRVRLTDSKVKVSVAYEF